MLIFILTGFLVVLALLVMYALILGGYYETPGQILEAAKAITLKKADVSLEFRDWVDTDLQENPELRKWVLGLPDEGFAALTQRLAAFCADMNIQLEWLTGRHIDVAPAARQAANTVVVDYLKLCRKALSRQNDVALFATYHKIVANPSDARYRDARRRLFTRLIAENLAQPLPAYEMIMASETQRQELAVKAIREAAAKDWTVFTRVLGEASDAGGGGEK